MERHHFTSKEDKIIKKCTSENIGNLRDGFRQAAIIIGVSVNSIEKRYYRIRPDMSKTASLKKLIFGGGFFILSKNRILLQGKNTWNSKIKAQWLHTDTTKELLNYGKH